MPVTFWSMTVGFAALAGIPPASGFFSKDTILAQAWRAARDRGRSDFGWFAYAPLGAGTHSAGVPAWTGWLVLISGLLTAAVTAAYATRTWLVTFFGERRSPSRRARGARADALARRRCSPYPR